MGIRRQAPVFARWRLRLTGPTNCDKMSRKRRPAQAQRRPAMNIRRDAMVRQKSIFTVNCTSRGSPILVARGYWCRSRKCNRSYQTGSSHSPAASPDTAASSYRRQTHPPPHTLQIIIRAVGAGTLADRVAAAADGQGVAVIETL